MGELSNEESRTCFIEDNGCVVKGEKIALSAKDICETHENVFEPGREGWFLKNFALLDEWCNDSYHDDDYNLVLKVHIERVDCRLKDDGVVDSSVRLRSTF